MVKLNKIYTKTGDDGTTGLGGGNRVAKYQLRVDAYGTVDEAGCAIGLARLHTEGAEDLMLARIQNDLFDLGADLSTLIKPNEDPDKTLRITAAQTKRLEGEIDAMNAELQPLESFILAGGTPAAAALHLGRAVVRRAERLAYALAAKEAVNEAALRYLNRLSDHLFVLGRRLNGNGKRDVLWRAGAHTDDDGGNS